MMHNRPLAFRPVFGMISPTTLWAAQGTTPTTRQILSAGDTMLLTNAGPEAAFVRWGDENVPAATNGDMVVLSGQQIVVQRLGASHVSVRSAQNTTTVYVTAGTGG